jgi:hypothetical protein
LEVKKLRNALYRVAIYLAWAIDRTS